MPDREKVIKGLKWFRDRDLWREGIMIHDDHAEVRKRICDDAIALLKEQKWHIFHENEDGVMDVECVPNNGEEFLWYRKHSGYIEIAQWSDDDWAEYACTSDGEPFEDGDAWMELPKPPIQ